MGSGFLGRALVCLVVFTSFFSHANCSNEIAAASVHPTYGWEVEYVPGENPGLWNYYRPEAFSEAEWLATPLATRDAWVTENTKALAPTLRIPAGLVRLSAAPAFLPDRLIRDETGNWEIIGPVTDSFDEMQNQMRTVEAAVAAGSYQAHVAMPIARLERGAAGYTLFSTDLLTFRKFSTQLARYRKDPKAVPGAFFLHGFLSVFSDMKKDMMLKVMDFNMAGQGWERVIPYMHQKYPEYSAIWIENRPYYKYTMANTFRTDIYGNEGDKLVRFGFEVRSAHKSLETLMKEVVATRNLATRSFAPFERFEKLEVVKPATFANRFSTPVQEMLKAVIPDGDSDDQRPYYFTFLYRPFEQFTSLLDLNASTSRELRRQILKARSLAVEALEGAAARFAAGSLAQKDAKDQAMLALANFCEETGLLPYLEAYLARHTGEQEVRRVAGG